MLSERSGSYFFIGILIAAAAIVAMVFLPELNVIVLGVSLAVLFQPWFAALKHWLQGKGGIAALLIVVLAIVLVLVPLIFFGVQIFFEAQGLYGRISSGGGIPGSGWLRAELQRVLPSVNINFNTYTEQILSLLISDIGPIFSGLLSVVATFFLSFFALYYFLKDGAVLKAAVVKWSPLPAERTREIIAKIQAMMSSVVRGSLLVGVFYGVLTGIGFFIFGLPSAILWGGVTAIASFIPGIGVLLVVVPGIVSLALGGHSVAAFGLTVWLFAMSSSMEMIVRPRLIGRKGKVHPLLMLFALLGGLSVFGPIGLLFGPLALGIFLTLLEVYPLFALENLTKK
jgi:predicted PurR-regulated permease PerM